MSLNPGAKEYKPSWQNTPDGSVSVPTPATYSYAYPSPIPTSHYISNGSGLGAHYTDYVPTAHRFPGGTMYSQGGYGGSIHPGYYDPYAAWSTHHPEAPIFESPIARKRRILAEEKAKKNQEVLGPDGQQNNSVFNKTDGDHPPSAMTEENVLTPTVLVHEAKQGSPTVTTGFRDISPENPLILLFIGCRGAGKSTQAELAARKYNLLHISSGDICKDGKEPFSELRRIAVKEFGESSEKKYNGLALDRFIVRSEIDAYYLQHALDAANLPVPLLVWLRVDAEVGLERAAARGDKKEASSFWRLEEQRIHPVVVEKIFRPIDSMISIDCTSSDVNEVFSAIHMRISKSNSGRSKEVRLPEVRKDFDGDLLTDYEEYHSLCSEVHAAVGNTNGRIDSAPLSSMASYIDRRAFLPENMKKNGLVSSFVTLKADGERYVLIKHSSKGFFAFPSKFTHCFHVTEFLKNVKLSPCPEFESRYRLQKEKETEVEFILDTELCKRKDYSTFFIIDFVFFYGAQGTRMRFAQRYDLLQAVIRKSYARPALELKRYVPINMLKSLLPSLDKAPFPIDGIVFQHGDLYYYGADKLLSKWKPRELCTVDFRLAHGRKVNNDWEYDLHVGVFANGEWREESFPGAVGIFSAEEQKQYNLGNSVIAELALVEQDSGSRWKLHRCRHDKSGPNKYTIVEKIVSMDHLDYSALVELTSAIPFAPLPPAHYAAFSHK